MTRSWEKLTVAELEKELRRHNDLYFVQNRPEISDEEFDLLVETLRRKKPGSPALLNVGSDIAGAVKTIRHQRPMLSLDKCYHEKDLLHWASKFEGAVIAMPKIDGCAVSLRYDGEGRLALGLTRGNGIEGEVITGNVRHVRGVPQKIGLRNVEIRGEIYMPLSVFDRFSEAFANPRNLAAGGLKQKDPEKTGEYHLVFAAYDLLGSGAETEMEKRILLKREKIPAVATEKIAKGKMEAIFDVWGKKRFQLDYEIDGVVFRADEVKIQESLGSTAHHPRYAIAYKFLGDTGETRLKEIFWSVSRSGMITPVGIVEPVNLSGATVTRVSLHNYGFAQKQGITVPAKVRMARRGGVIPKLEEVLEGRGKPIHAPRRCPSCGGTVVQRDDFLYCENPRRCGVSKVGELNHFVKTAGIDGFGRKHLEQLYAKGLVEDPADFFALEKEDLIPLERMGETLAAKLVANIRSRKKLPLDIFLRSLGIHELGKHVAQILAGFGSLEAVLRLGTEELAAVHTIGEKIAGFVVAGLKEKRGLIERLLEHVTVEKGPLPAKGGPLEGKSFLFTGTLKAMSREEAQALVEKKGGKSATGVSKNLDYLVVGSGGGAGSKLEKIKKLQQSGAKTEILTEAEFLKKAT